MKQRKNGTPLFAVCIDNSGYPASLELHKIYRIISDNDAAADGDLRIVDESGEDYLYSAKRFIVMDLPRALKRALLSTPKSVRRVTKKKSAERHSIRV